ncbi:MAG: hypothetical protein KAY37_01415 [Phycisphaerae bacterium]|nr:hypothetical protein [Phycisphaerae bacterium]
MTLSITVSLGVRADRKRLATAAERQRTEGSKPSRGFPAYLALPWLVNLVALFVAAWVAVDLVVKAKKTGTLAGLTPVQFAAVVTAVFGLICVVSALAVWAALRLRLGFLAQSEMPPKPIEVSPDEAAQQLARQWPALRPPPKLPAVQAALNLLPQDVSPPARIVVLGDFELPEVGDLRFEPEVFSPTRLLGTRLIVAAGVVGAGLAWWALGYTGFVPWAARDNPFTMTVYLVIPALVLWVWRGALRATYLRLAPGVVQVLVYQYPWSKKPTIRDYPIEGGTLAVVANSAYGLKLTLARGSQKDTVTFSLLAKKKEATDRLLEALLSTAPRPPLSLTALVG